MAQRPEAPRGLPPAGAVEVAGGEVPEGVEANEGVLRGADAGSDRWDGDDRGPPFADASGVLLRGPHSSRHRRQLRQLL